MSTPQQWLPIDTAPRDRTVMTDDGPARWVDTEEATYWAQSPGWFMALGLSEHLIEDADSGIQRSGPRWWIQLPPVPKTAP